MIASALVLAACTSGATPTPSASPPPSAATTSSPGATPGASELPLPTPTALASPWVWGPATWVTGREACSVDRGTITDEPDGITHHARDGTVICTDEANDPRVSGRVTGSVNMDFWGPNETDGALVEWATVRLENALGAWVGQVTGTFNTMTGDRLLTVYTGIGAYKGLSYLQWASPTPSEVFAGTTYVGLIFPGDPPPR